MKHIFSIGHSSPSRLAGLSILGSLLTIAAFLVLFVFHTPPCPAPLAAGLSSLVCLVAGIVLSLRATSALKNGIENDAWTDEQLAPIRAKAQWPIWTPLSILFILASLGFLIFGGHAHPGLAYPFLLPAQAIIQLRQALTPRRPLGPGSSILQSELRPIHSDHWGER